MEFENSQIQDMKAQLYDLWFLLTEFQKKCGPGQSSFRQINEFKEIISNFLNSSLVDELVASLSILGTAAPHLENQQENEISTLFDSILSAMPSLIFLQDQIGRINYVNSAVTSAWNIPLDRIFGKTLHELTNELGFSDTIKEILYAQNRAAILTSQMANCEIEFLDGDDRRCYTCTFHPISTIDLILCIMTEITVSRNVESELKQVENAYFNLLDSIHSAALVIYLNTFEIVDANQKAAQLFQCDRPMLLAQKLSKLDLLFSKRLRNSILYLEPGGHAKFRHVIYLSDMSEIPVAVACSLTSDNLYMIVLIDEN